MTPDPTATLPPRTRALPFVAHRPRSLLSAWLVLPRAGGRPSSCLNVDLCVFRKVCKFFISVSLKPQRCRRKEALVTEGLSFFLLLAWRVLCGSVPCLVVRKGPDADVGLKEGGNPVPRCTPGLWAPREAGWLSPVSPGASHRPSGQ